MSNSHFWLVEHGRVPDYPITRPENVTTRSYPIPDFSIFQLPDTRKLIFGYPRVEDRVFLLNKNIVCFPKQPLLC